MYHFNPISDTSLFDNMGTQHLYNPKDKNIEGMNRYIYWYTIEELRSVLKKNETIKLGDGYRHIENNIDKLEEWSGKKYDRIIHDDTVDGKESQHL